MVKLELASIMAIRSLLPRVFVESYGLQFRWSSNRLILILVSCRDKLSSSPLFGPSYNCDRLNQIANQFPVSQDLYNATEPRNSP